ncbi:MAG: hypothetical protein RSP_15620 [Rhodanobacter sp.]
MIELLNRKSNEGLPIKLADVFVHQRPIAISNLVDYRLGRLEFVATGCDALGTELHCQIAPGQFEVLKISRNRIGMIRHVYRSLPVRKGEARRSVRRGRQRPQHLLIE